MKSRRVLAFDIGGTKIASAIVEINGDKYKILDYKRSETPKEREKIIAKMLDLVDFYKSIYSFRDIGIGVAGQINEKGDTVISSPNIPGFENFRLGKVISAKVGCRVSVRNDVRCFALGEDRFGKYGNCDNAVFIAFGTGIGGAVKINKKFYFGKDNIAGEFGHMVIEKDGIECACGRKGCWERYVSGPALEAMYEKVYGQNKASKDIVHDGVRGSEKDRGILLKAISSFSTGIANIANVLDPEIIIVGGSFFKDKGLLKLAIPAVKEEVLLPARRIRIVNSSLGDNASLLGAAL